MTGSAVAQSANGPIDLGMMHEFCNDSAGYQIWVDTPRGFSNAAFYVDGQRVTLSSTGSTMIANSPTAASRVRHLQFDGKGVQAVSIRIVAL